MPTSREGDIVTNAPWSLKSKNDSKRRDMVTEQRNPDNVGSKNRGSTDKERPHQMTSNRNESVPSTESPTVSRTQRKAHNSPDINKDLFATKSVNKGAASKNKSSAPEHPEPKIASGKTKVHNYPAGRNRGRNFKS